MSAEFPYQLVVFLNKEPKIGEAVYYGENGWYPQLALKRRFRIEGINEEQLRQKLESYFSDKPSLTIIAKDLIHPEKMPVGVVGVEQTPELMSLHLDIIKMMGEDMISRYPERDGSNYFPHITVEYNGERVVDAGKYARRTFVVSKVWLLKDVRDENSIAYIPFSLT